MASKQMQIAWSSGISIRVAANASLTCQQRQQIVPQPKIIANCKLETRASGWIADFKTKAKCRKLAAVCFIFKSSVQWHAALAFAAIDLPTGHAISLSYFWFICGPVQHRE
jgi:hypothetical protein